MKIACEWLVLVKTPNRESNPMGENNTSTACHAGGSFALDSSSPDVINCLDVLNTYFHTYCFEDGPTLSNMLLLYFAIYHAELSQTASIDVPKSMDALRDLRNVSVWSITTQTFSKNSATCKFVSGFSTSS